MSFFDFVRQMRKTLTPLRAAGILVAILASSGFVLGLGGWDGLASWEVRVHAAAMAPLAFSDRWYITPEGYHIHRACEGFTPGLELDFAFRMGEYFETGFNVLVGRNPAYLGVIDENSQKEFHGSEGMGFLAVSFSPALAFSAKQEWSFSLEPLLGYGWIQTRRVTPTFGSSVTSGKQGQGVFGARIAARRALGNSPFFLSGGVFTMAMKVGMEEDGLGQRQTKWFGPFGILFGLAYWPEGERKDVDS
jgi:hypothetical protein